VSPKASGSHGDDDEGECQWRRGERFPHRRAGRVPRLSRRIRGDDGTTMPTSTTQGEHEDADGGDRSGHDDETGHDDGDHHGDGYHGDGG